MVSATYTGPAEPPAGGAAAPAPPAGARAGHRPGRARTARSATPFELTTGRWAITVTASSPEGKTTSLTRAVTVAFKGVNLVVSIEGGRPGSRSGWTASSIPGHRRRRARCYSNGKTLTFTGKESVEVRTGLVGRDQVHAQRDVARRARPQRHPETWLFAPPAEPGDPAPLTDVPPTDEELARPRRSASGRRAGRRGVTLATAESCTGGLVAHLITEVPGSSAYFPGGLVTYAERRQDRLVDVPPDVLEAHGAVSAQVGGRDGRGARRRLGVDVAVAVTGVAGPDGGTDAKPVGLTYVAVADADGDDVRRYHVGRRPDREQAG